MKAIAAAFVKAKRSFGPALKDKNNPAFRSKYADLGACIDAVEDALLENGIALSQETSLDETGVTVETLLIHESGEVMRFGKLHVPASKQDPQGYGSALTYCRRYSLMAACGIAPEDDDGNAASKTPARQQQPAPQKPAAKPAYDHAAALKWLNESTSIGMAEHRNKQLMERAETPQQKAELTKALNLFTDNAMAAAA